MKPFDVVEIRFKGSRKGFFRNTEQLDFTLDDLVVVQADTGYDVGHVSLKGELVKLQLKKKGLTERSEVIRDIHRVANERDIAKWEEAKEMEVKTQYKAREIAIELGLEMKISDVEYQGDKRKATFYYTAEGRVDFRELIKRLADTFKVKIEMRQVSYREEAGRLGAIGSCGRVLCCSTWLTDFKQVNTGAARYQNLSLNPLKLSGQCGRLKCCLNFELEAYIEALKEFPKGDRFTLETERGSARVQKTDILRRIMWFSYSSRDANWVAMPVEEVNRIAELNKKGEKPADLLEDKFLALATQEEEPDFKDMVGEDSITRMDNRARKGNKPRKKNRNKKPRPKANPSNQSRPSKK